MDFQYADQFMAFAERNQQLVLEANDSVTTVPINGATGEAYGMELMLQKIGSSGDSPLSGWVSYALAWAEVLDCDDVFIGVNALDYSGYPDCRPEYIAAFEAMAVTSRARSRAAQVTSA